MDDSHYTKKAAARASVKAGAPRKRQRAEKRIPNLMIKRLSTESLINDITFDDIPVPRSVMLQHHIRLYGTREPILVDGSQVVYQKWRVEVVRQLKGKSLICIDVAPLTSVELTRVKTAIDSLSFGPEPWDVESLLLELEEQAFERTGERG